MKKFLKDWFPVLFAGVIIFVLSTIPQVESPVKIEHLDLLFHAVFYALLAFLLIRALGLEGRKKRRWVSLIAVTFCAVYGALIELYQNYLPTRTMELVDGIANTIGAVIGVGLYIIYHSSKRRMAK